MEAEAIALLMVVQPRNRLSYSQVTFIGDCKQLFDFLNLHRIAEDQIEE